MALKIYNSLSHKKEIFKTVEPGLVKMYVCGMTVYSDAHIGHARTYLAFDIIRRYFEYKGYRVFYIQNITDVDDKIIAAAQREIIDVLEYSRRYTERCLHDLDTLGIRRADLYPKASETIPDMIEMIKVLIDKGYAYVADGDVYFSVERFSDYGKLSRQRLSEMKAGARVEPGEKKKNPLDFTLWKKSKPGEPSWPSPWGSGRPGWHIECSAMSSKYLGLPFDIHGGGMDLRFPHHENEIAQSESATGKNFANYWMHVGLLTVNGEKMSKSLGNIVNIRDILKKYNPEVIRLFLAQTHYRSPPDFNDKALIEAERNLDRIYRVKEKLEDCIEGKMIKTVEETAVKKEDKTYLRAIQRFREGFEESMDDDFNTPRAFAFLFDFINNTNKYLDGTKNVNYDLCSLAFDTLLKIGNTLTLFQDSPGRKDENDTAKRLRELIVEYRIESQVDDVKTMVDLLLKYREKARMMKDYTTADDIRGKLIKLGFEIQDTDKGPVWRKKI
ncbi:MAG: cysteine--tRNA ligase [Candidatus Thermoplasmatota archaeon]